MASMFVIGIDFGNESSYIAVPRAGGIEIISFSNTFSVRATSTTSYVAFSDRNRILGVAAKNQLIRNLKNTIFGFKRLLGKCFDDPDILHDLRYAPYPIIRCKDGTIGVKVRYLDEECVFSIQQITAMFFTKLKETAEVALKCEVNECVISVPSFLDNAERQALLDAAINTIAGLKVSRIFNETAATALSYGIYKQDLPTPEEPPRNVIFVDCGHSSLQVSACAFNRGKMKMLASTADPHLGGRDIDIILAEYFSDQFKSKYKIEPTKNPRAMLRLLDEVEKLKKQMSANSTKIPLNIECFMNDIDVHGDLKRTDMEELCAGLFERVEQTMLRCLQESKLKKEEIHSIEIVGGSSRVPAIKSLIEKVFGKVPSTTLNQDEAVARGCALQCAMLCPAILVRDFSITDVQNYPIKVIYDTITNEDLEVFPKNHPIPFAKNLIFCKSEPFELKAVYGHNNKLIGKFIVNDVKPDAEGQSQTVKVKVRITINGIFTVPNATLSEKQEINDHGEPMEISQPHPGSKSVENENREKRAVKTTDLPVKVELVGAYSSNELNDLKEQECKMISTDRQERNRIDTRNALVEYVYKLRGKLSSPDELATFVPDEEREKLCQQLDEIETWIYEEGDDCEHQVYSDKLKSLQGCGEPIKKRKFEFEVQPLLLEEFSSFLQLTQKAVDQYNAGVETYSHLERNDVRRIQESTNSALRWLEYLRNELNVASRHQNLRITADQIKSEKNTFEQEVTKVFQKPKPQQPPTPPQEPSQEEASKCVSVATTTHLTALLRKQKYFIRMIDSLELTDNLDAKEAKIQSKHLEKFYDEFIRIQSNIAALVGDNSLKVHQKVRRIETKLKEIISSNKTVPCTSAGTVINWHFNPSDDLDTSIKKQKSMIKELESIESTINPSKVEAELLGHRLSEIVDQFLKNHCTIASCVSGSAVDEQSRILDNFLQRSSAVEDKLEE